MQQEPQFRERKECLKPLEIFICCHENACFSSLALFRSVPIQSKGFKEPSEIAIGAFWKGIIYHLEMGQEDWYEHIKHMDISC